MPKFYVILILVFSLTGCTMFSKLSSRSAPGIAAGGGVQVIQPASLKKGGTVLIIPFTAGSDVAETDELDRISLRLVKGMAEQFKSGPGVLRPVFGTEVASPDFQLEGHITKKSLSGGLRRWFKKPRRTLGVSGRMVDINNGQEVLVFNERLTRTGSSEGFEVLAAQLGRQVAKDILGAIH